MGQYSDHVMKNTRIWETLKPWSFHGKEENNPKLVFFLSSHFFSPCSQENKIKYQKVVLFYSMGTLNKWHSRDVVINQGQKKKNMISHHFSSEGQMEVCSTITYLSPVFKE